MSPPAFGQESVGFTLDSGGDLSAFLDCHEAASQTLISAHRGGPSAGLPENAIETMDAILTAYPVIMEVDIARTADGTHALMHDRTLDRTTTGTGNIYERDWQYVSGLHLTDSSGWVTPYRVPTLAMALEWARGRTILQLDFKRSADLAEVAQLVRDAGMEQQVILIAYTIEQAQELHVLLPEAMISFSIQQLERLEEAEAAGLPADRIVAFTGTRIPRPELYAALDAMDVEVIFGTLGRPPRSIDSMIERFGTDERYVELGEGGVDILATDRPRDAARALREAGRMPEIGLCGVNGPLED
ncbi:glycerophosphodiester phosphodiesterase family protein [Aurantiacibacter sediminis]|nr:glycerophosphodiester phosphodiesterase family protein [Aurantiacibacter sediminis]